MFRALPKIILAVAILAIGVVAQNPVKWSLETTPSENLAAGTKIKATIKAEIEAPWKLYSIDQPPGGPFATTIKLDEKSSFTIDGKITTQKPIVKEDPNFIIDDKPLLTRSFAERAEFYVPVVSNGPVSIALLAFDVRFQVCTETTCLPPKTVRVSTSGFEDLKRTVANTALSASPATPILSTTQSTDIWAFIWLAITFGAISLLTPCVFPMIPITVSYFMKHSDGDRARTIKLATVYSVGIIATFSLLGMLLAVAFGAAGINLFAANPWVNIGIAAIFLFFAFNLFGFYEITIPSSVLSKLDKITRAEEGKGSAYIGALLMGLTFTLTSFTCTSPFIGTILVSTAQGDWTMPLLGMLIFSTVFALPFFVLATVPRLLSSLPKSGGWLNSVKVVMGFLEIAAALKFLSNVDLVWGAAYKTGTSLNYGLIFTREVVLTIWVIIGLAIVAYILGLFKFRHDSPIKKVTPLRVLFALMFLGLCVYLTSGILGRKLGELESFLPPKNRESRFNVLGNKEAELHWIHNDYQAALTQAKAENKPVFIDFTGYTCTNCRWMEANMFPVPEVKSEMEKYVLVGLYTDGDGEVYERQQQFQEATFQTVALPFYAIVNADGVPLATFPGLTRNPQEFIDFLQKANKN